MKSVIRGVLVLWLVAVFLVGAPSGCSSGRRGRRQSRSSSGPWAHSSCSWPHTGVRPAFVRSFWRSTFPWRRRSRLGGPAGSHFWPGVFAWPAGLGDIAIGVTAPWVAIALVRRPGFVTHRVFVVWNLLGTLDLVVAVSIGGLNSALASGVAGEVTSGPTAQLPLVLIPAYFVPLFIMLHLAALFQAQRHALTRHSRRLA
jgi:hypothetical protein